MINLQTQNFKKIKKFKSFKKTQKFAKNKNCKIIIKVKNNWKIKETTKEFQKNQSFPFFFLAKPKKNMNFWQKLQSSCMMAHDIIFWIPNLY